MIELFIDKKKERPILSLNGPLYHTREYRCEKLYCLHADVLSLLKIANDVMDDFGDYHYLTNNCQTFVKKLIKEVQNILVAYIDGYKRIKWEHIQDMMKMCFKETSRQTVNNLSEEPSFRGLTYMSFDDMIYQFKQHEKFDCLEKGGQLKGDWSAVRIAKKKSIEIHNAN